ncbi:LytTR family DNA-binding domain-containing protein [Bacillus sp. FJAT-47783]|uniref:LytR/AlgR family response regulator transcription factor n=1 Tax=Bacillus sp. FJAT-47783 TaxID=2922712 RepID=UPI001FAB36B7|nr:LytTR family DNA-binding domain-containing protein [Bacillus sp. FJAT-47783]
MTKVISVLIVDDERYSRDELKHLLSQYSAIQIVAEADSGESAIMKTIQHQPDCIFLDIEMPKMNGMEVAKSLLELKKVPFIIFATAYPDFAAEAFRYEAIDYLLKPYEEDQLAETIDRLKKRMQNEKPVQSEPSPSKLAIEGDEQIHYMNPADIYYIYREERVTKIVGQDSEYEVKTPLKELEARLAPHSFFRIHKSYLVNLQYVSRLIPWFNGAYQLELKGVKEKLSVSRNYVKALRERLEL